MRLSLRAGGAGCHARPCVCTRWRAAFAGAAAALVMASTAAAGASADPVFRKWADESMRTLRDSRSADARAKAAEYLGGFEHPEAVDALQAALRDPDAKVRAAAASALWKTGEPARAARPALVAALDDPAPAVVIRAAGALETLGVPERDLVAPRRRVLDAPGVTTDDRFMAARGLVGAAPPLVLLPPVLDVLERSARPQPSSAQSIDQRHTYESAVHAVERLARTKDRALVAPLLDAARSARYSQPALLAALALFEPKPDDWTGVLLGFLDAPDPKARHAALALLGRQLRAADVERWSPRVAALLHDPDELVRSEAVWVLGRAGGLAAGQADALVAMLGDPDPAMRRRVAEALGEMGERTQAVTAATKTRVADAARGPLASLASSDPDADVRDEAKKSLARLDGVGSTSRGAPAGDAAARAPDAPSRATPAPPRRADAGAEARAVALLRERRIAVEPGAYFQALATTDVEVVRAFLDTGMSAADPVAGGGPPLVVALQAGDACSASVRPTREATRSIVRLLLDRGADANRGDAKGFTPLMAAAMSGCDRVVMKMLLAAGAKAGTTNAAGLAAFDMGVFQGHDGLEELIAAGYRLSPDKASAYEKAFAGKPAVIALVRKATRK